MQRWARLRDRWFETTAADLDADGRVLGWGLVGSFGRGEADTWSDLDLLVIVHDRDFDAFAASSGHWSTTDWYVDARRNAPAGAISIASIHVRDGLPIGADWYVYPAAMAGWPTDCAIRRGADRAPHVGAVFADWNGRGPRQAPLAQSPDEARVAQLMMAVVAGKHIARRSPDAVAMIELLGGARPGSDARDQLAALRDRVAELAVGSPPGLVAAVERYLALVESTE